MSNTTVTIEDWLTWAREEADRLQLPALKPLVESLARSTAALRAADWNEVEEGGDD